MKVLVVYYSHKGSNKYLAQKIAEALGADLIELKPWVPGLSILATAVRFSPGIRPVKTDLSAYDRVVVCGAIYIGSLSAPCRDFIRKYGKQIKKIDIITCCGSTDEKKEDKFGYETVFKQLREQLGECCGECLAFPIDLVLTDSQKEDDQAMMNTRLDESNFSGAVKERLDEFVSSLGNN